MDGVFGPQYNTDAVVVILSQLFNLGIVKGALIFVLGLGIAGYAIRKVREMMMPEKVTYAARSDSD